MGSELVDLGLSSPGLGPDAGLDAGLPDPPPGPAPLTRAVVCLLGHVAALGDVHRVAATVRTPPRTVLRQIDRLEQVHGSPVARRAGARLALTELGHRLLVASRAFYLHVDGALERATGRPAAGRSLRLASTLHLDIGLLHELATTDLPLLRVELHDASGCLARYEDYQVDGALVWSMGDPADRCRRDHAVATVIDDPLWVVVPDGHPLGGRSALHLADLLDETWVSGVDEQGRPIVARAFARHGLPAPGRMQVADSPSLAQCMGLRSGALTLQRLSMIPDVSWASARPLVESLSGHLVLLGGAALSPDHLEQLAFRVRRHLLARLVGRGLTGRWAQDLAAWHRRQSLRLTPSSAAPTTDTVKACHRSTRTPYPLDLGDVEVLAAVTRQGSINRAAASLSMSQPALTRRLQRLEAELGAQLLFRDSRGARPTEFLERLLRGFEEASRRFAGVVGAAARPGYAGSRPVA